MADDSKIVNEATTVDMIRAFGEAQSECKTIQGLVDGANSALMNRWGGEAATKYSQSMAEWQDGFNKVRAALDLLNVNMVDYSKITGTTEDDNIVSAGNWALPAGH